jgi:hypothetical protein
MVSAMAWSIASSWEAKCRIVVAMSSIMPRPRLFFHPLGQRQCEPGVSAVRINAASLATAGFTDMHRIDLVGFVASHFVRAKLRV